MRYAGRYLACMLFAMMEPASVLAEEPHPVSVCEIDANPDAFVGREVVVEGRLIRSPHGMYSDMADCPTIYLMVIRADGAQPGIASRLVRAASDIGSPDNLRAPPVIMHGRVELNDHTLQGTTHVYKRLMLAVRDIEPITSAR